VPLSAEGWRVSADAEERTKAIAGCLAEKLALVLTAPEIAKTLFEMPTDLERKDGCIAHAAAVHFCHPGKPRCHVFVSCDRVDQLPRLVEVWADPAEGVTIGQMELGRAVVLDPAQRQRVRDQCAAEERPR
jgi:hypothetical protein